MDFYFSDANILKDSFLLKHVRRNKEGFVNLKLITSFKKMKTLTRDYRVVAFSLRRHSKIMVVNEDGNKARRKVPLPDYDETKTSRTVVVFNLPAEPSPTMESVSNLFKDCGDIVMLQIHKAGKTSVPSDIKKHIARFTDGASVTCAVIEFEKHEQAQKAVAKGVDGDDWKEGLKVLMLASKGKNTIGDDSESDSEFKQKKRNKKKTLRSQALEKEWEGMSSGSEGDFLMPRPRSRNSSFGSDKSYNGKNSPSRSMLSPTSADKTWTSPNGSSISNQRRRSVPLPQSPLAENSKNSPKPSPKPSPRSSPRASPEMRRRANSGGMQKSPPEPSGNSPWVQRRMAASREMSPLAKGAGGRKMEAITRAPRGPEPGKGFYGGKGRGKPLMATQC